MSQIVEDLFLNTTDLTTGEHNTIDLVYSETPISFLTYERVSGGELEIPIYPGREIRIGRDPNKCEAVIPNELVSKQHFRIYSIIYELERSSDLQPLVYCEDLETTNGTYVNNQCIGMICREKLGYLLVHGDIIEIRPNWRFQFHQPSHSIIHRDGSELNDLRYFADQYTVSNRVLGKGHYGAVFLAKEVSTSRQLACKIVNLDSAAQEITGNLRSDIPGRNWLNNIQRAKEGRKLVLREINILSKLNHPNIIKLKKAFCSDDALYMFTELAPGGDLFSYIESHGGCLSDWHSRVVARQIVLAIEFMHSNGIVHRDLKPENVLIMQTDFGGRIVLTDFGFANYVNEKTGRLLSRLGTEGFIAPEVEFVDMRSGGYTMAADMWSLGVLTACLLTGHSLIPREEISQLSQKQIADRFLGMDNSPVRNQWQYMPRRALKFLRRALVIEAENRMTATQALNHEWFKKPETEAALIEEGYNRIIKFWKKRDNSDRVIEDLPRRRRTPEEQLTEQGPKLRRKIPDTTLSPYFGLDRHLQQRESSQRRNILDNLNESGSLFLSSQGSQRTHHIEHRGKEQDVAIRSVPSHDIFSSSSESQTTQGSFESSEFRAMLGTMAAHRGTTSKRRLPSDGRPPEGSPTGANKRSISRKTARRESEDLDERKMHDEISKMLPKYSSAKVFSDELKKKKLEKQKTRIDTRARDMSGPLESVI